MYIYYLVRRKLSFLRKVYIRITKIARKIKATVRENISLYLFVCISSVSGTCNKKQIGYLIAEVRGGNRLPAVSEVSLPAGHRRKHRECYHPRRPRPPSTDRPAWCRHRDPGAARQGCTLIPEVRRHPLGESTLSSRFLPLRNISTRNIRKKRNII